VEVTVFLGFATTVTTVATATAISRPASQSAVQGGWFSHPSFAYQIAQWAVRHPIPRKRTSFCCFAF
jgi:transposase